MIIVRGRAKERQVNELQYSEKQVEYIIDSALAEDTVHGDITSEILIPPELQGIAYIIVKAKGIIAGNEIAKMVFHRIDQLLEINVFIRDGAEVKPGDKVATIQGNVRSIFKAERVALNFLQHLSGIATQTHQYITKISSMNVVITDTRKTTPGLRSMEKYAVRMGGGTNHRFHLGDGILIKDNHLATLRAVDMNLKDIIAKAKQNLPQEMKIEVEVNTITEAISAAEAGADIIMLDNMSLEEICRAVSLIPSQIKTEASGGITMTNIRAVAETGVNFISIGAITHSSKALDISLEMESGTLKLI
ncbi:carboxylating nicotinate-nucleotide diphosphorylase [Chloroflexota bacterium]